MDNILNFDQNTTVRIDEHPDDKPADMLLCGEVGRILSESYPEWAWYVDIPPDQDILIIRNLTCDPRGTYGLVIHKSKLNKAQLRIEIAKAAGAFLERYESKRGHYGKFKPEDVDELQANFTKPQV